MFMLLPVGVPVAESGLVAGGAHLVAVVLARSAQGQAAVVRG